MSNTELSDQLNYDTSNDNNNNDNNNDNLVQFAKDVTISFIGIFVWGILGSTTIFWLRHAANTRININSNVSCYKQDNNDGRNNINFLDIYFPYNEEKLPYNLPQNCGNSKASVVQIDNNVCDNLLSSFKSKNFENIDLVKRVSFPYNFLDTTDETDKLDNQLKKSPFYEKIGPMIKKIYKQGLKNPFIDSRWLLNKFFNLTSSDWKRYFPSQLIMILAKFIFALIIFLKFFSGLFIPIYHVFKDIFNTNLLPITGDLLCKSAADYVFEYEVKTSNDNSIINNIKKGFIGLAKFLVFVFVVFPLSAIDIILAFICCALLLIFFAPLFGFIFLVSLINIFVQMLSLFEGVLKSGKFLQIFKCNINLLIFLFGFLVFMSAKHNLDPYMFKFVGISWALYVCYTLFKMLMD